MKFLKISIILLICSFCLTEVVVFATDASQVPVSGTFEVKTGTWDSTPTKEKVNNKYQKLMISHASCEGCTFKARPVYEGVTNFNLTTFEVGDTKTLDSQAILEGTWHVEATRDNFSLITRNAVYTYDPNVLYL